MLYDNGREGREMEREERFSADLRREVSKTSCTLAPFPPLPYSFGKFTKQGAIEPGSPASLVVFPAGGKAI